MMDRGHDTGDPCCITIQSPRRDDRAVGISTADVISRVTDVLNECASSGSGGAYTFEGNWEVVVTRDPLKSPWAVGEVGRAVVDGSEEEK